MSGAGDIRSSHASDNSWVFVSSAPSGAVWETSSPSDNSPFQYTPLKPNHIRLLQYVGHPSNIKLMDISFDDTPQYIALSYTWGDPRPCRPITCNNQSMVIPSNLNQALEVVYAAVQRSSAPPLYAQGEAIFLWADGICINQSDAAEKNAQVSMMAEIYRRARGAIGYLGAPSPSIDPSASFEAFAQFCVSKVNDNKPQQPPALDGGGTTSNCDRTPVRSDDDGGKRPPVRSDGDEFWNSAWYERSWVTQEAVLTKVMMCLFGDEARAVTFSIDQLITLMYRAWQLGVNPSYLTSSSSSSSGPSSPLIHVKSWSQLRHLLAASSSPTGSGLPLISVLRSLRPTQATDPRDKVYAALGLVKPAVRAAIKVDYAPSNTAQRVYTDVARHHVATGYGPALLEHAGTKRGVGYEDMPTWVPDWSDQARVPLAGTFYRAAGNTELERVEVSPCGRKMLARAFTFDKIALDSYVVAYPECKLEDPALPDVTEPLIINLLEDTCRSFCADVRERCGRNPGVNPDDPVDGIIYNVLTMGCIAGGTRRSVPDDVKRYHAYLKDHPQLPDPPGQFIKLIKQRSAGGGGGGGGGGGVDNTHQVFTGGVLHVQRGRMICLTQEGMIAVVPGDAKVGDWLALFPGEGLPFVLRHKERNEFEVVGQAYVHGAMDGELIARMEMKGVAADRIFKHVALV